MYVRGMYIACGCDIIVPALIGTPGLFGVDFGIVTVAIDSDGKSYTGTAIEKVRAHLLRRRAGLKRRGAKAAKRRLRKLSKRELRFQPHDNHVIWQPFVQAAQRSVRAIGLQDLTHIRDPVKARGQPGWLHNWSFGQLRQFVASKARLAGVPVLFVDRSHTSKSCSCCGCIDDRN
jgi:putative transposase